MTGRQAGRFTLIASMLLLAIARVSFAQSFGPAPILAGTWESQTPNNAYLLRVSWNESARRYEGALVRQGILSQQFGFALGELCWVATPTRNPATLELQEELRSGTNGVSTRAQWRRGVVRLDRTTPAELVTSSAVFHRVGHGNAPRVAPVAPPYGSGYAVRQNAPQTLPQRPVPATTAATASAGAAPAGTLKGPTIWGMPALGGVGNWRPSDVPARNRSLASQPLSKMRPCVNG